MQTFTGEQQGCRYRVLSPSLNAWDSFIKEYGLDVEWSQFKVDGKQHWN
jgi:hypothetical protein